MFCRAAAGQPHFFMKKSLFLFLMIAVSSALAADSYDPLKPTEGGPRKVLDFFGARQRSSA
jgi:hypothetical protein